MVNSSVSLVTDITDKTALLLGSIGACPAPRRLGFRRKVRCRVCHTGSRRLFDVEGGSRGRKR